MSTTAPTGSLTLERRAEPNRTINHGALSMTPLVEENYWSYRVRITDGQSIIGFPKLSTVGIGFAVEDDWNTNLPYGIRTAKIVRHICHNAGDDSITAAQMCEAVDLIRRAAYEDHGGPGDHLLNNPDWECGRVCVYDVAEVEREISSKREEIAAEMAEMDGES